MLGYRLLDTTQVLRGLYKLYPVTIRGRMMTDLSSTTRLLSRVSDGDMGAREVLLVRYLPLLRKWARGRLSAVGRDLAETEDLVQITLLRSLNNLHSFTYEPPGAFLAYLRTILMNALRDEIRRGARRPLTLSISISDVPNQSSVLDEVVGAEVMAAYEKALMTLSEEKRAAVLMRIEFDMTYEEIAEELQRSSIDGTRTMIVRALADITKEMESE